MALHDKKYTAPKLPKTPVRPVPDVPERKGGGAEKDCCSYDSHDSSSHSHHAHPQDSPAHDGHSHDGHSHDEGAASWWPTVVSLGLLLGGIFLDQMEVAWFSGALRWVVYGVAYLLTGGKVIWQALQRIAQGNFFNEFFLMSLATVGAFYLGEYAEGVAVMLFYVIGEHFQGAAVARSRQSIKALIDNRPAVVNLVKEGQVFPAEARKVAIGEVVQVKAGEKVALDGKLLGENGSFDTAALTGESRPQTKQKGDAVLAGMINQDRVVDLEVTATYQNSALAKILQLVEQAGSRKAKPQQFISRFAKVYTPVVVLLALGLTFLPYFFVTDYVFSQWLYRALIFLVVSCPCALVVSIPLGYCGGIGAASRNGILFKGSNYLDLITAVNCVVMDKTGTLTEGVFKVQDVQPANGVSHDELLTLTAALEAKSTHPVARAIAQFSGKTAQTTEVTEVAELPGLGIKGRVLGREVLAGNSRLLRKFGVAYDPAVDQEAGTVVLVAIDGQFGGCFRLGDQLKPDSAGAVQSLRDLGIRHVVMLSGDKASIVQQTAQTLGISQAYGDLLPQDKVERIEELKKREKIVAFVGDGINDAPAITLADVGVAMGGLGSDAAIETADIVIQTDQPAKIAAAIRVGRKTRQIVWQNIGLAFGVKLLVLSLGAFGVANLWEAVFADVGVAFLAILNAIRIQQLKF